jgi:hypothetical protein
MIRSLASLFICALAACASSAPQPNRDPHPTSDAVANDDGSPLIPCAARPEDPASFAALRVGARCAGCSSDLKGASSWAGPRISAAAVESGFQEDWPRSRASASIDLTCDTIDGGYRIAVEGRLQSFAAAWPRDRGAADRWAESTVVARANTPFTVRSASTYCLIVRRFDRAGVRTERDSNNLLSTPTRTEPTLVTLQTPAGIRRAT